jgi:cytochrome oxidase Cu insertion factor (SCO1/SenC/PrrC family)
MKNIALFLTIAYAFSGCFAKEPEKTGLEGKPLPAFDILLSDSITHFNTSNIPNGKPIVFFYFGPYCPYSRAQMEDIIKEMDLLKDVRLYLLTYAPHHQMKDFYSHYSLNKYPNIIVGKDASGFFQRYFEITGVPYVAIYGKDKRLNDVFKGEVYGRQIKKSTEN